MEVLFGGVTSLLYGVADFLGGQAAKRVSAASVVLWSGVIGFPFMVVLAAGVGGEASPADYLLGAVAGALGSVGLVLLFAGLGRGQAAAVAPVSAAVAAILPLAVALVDGERPSALAWIGVAIAIPAIALCAWVTEPGDVPFGGFLYGLAAGIGFGGFTALIRFTSPDSNLLPLIASRGSTMAMVLILAGFGVWRVGRFSSTPRGIVAANAILDASANVTLLVALRAGSLALAAVAASFFPAITVMLARWFNHEHLAVHQVAGLALSVAAIAAIAAG